MQCHCAFASMVSSLKGFNVETIELQGLNLTIWDVGGCDKVISPEIPSRQWRVKYSLKCARDRKESNDTLRKGSSLLKHRCVPCTITTVCSNTVLSRSVHCGVITIKTRAHWSLSSILMIEIG